MELKHWTSSKELLKKSLLSIAGLLLGLLLCLSFSVSSCQASEATYHLTEAELTRLENNLTELSKINSEQETLLKEQQEQLKNSDKSLEKANEKLSEADKKYKLLRSQMDDLSKELNDQQTLLETARLSFEKFEKEENIKKSRLKQERNFAYFMCAALAIWAVSK